MSCGIYQILNSKTGKCYVGSAVDIEDRWVHHKKKLSGGSGHHSIKLQRSWNKHDPSVWKWNILQECEEAKLLWLEAFWICTLDSFDNGYNSISITLDGERLVRRHSEETREKLRNRIITDETRKRISESAKGRVISPEQREKIRLAMLGRVITENIEKN
jgi:group I intron endonuclease